jgi:hypothetical protein
VDVAVDAFQDVVGPVSNACLERLLDAQWYPMRDQELAADCGAELGTAGACTHLDRSPYRVSVRSDLAWNREIRAHESLHMLFHCTGVSVNGDFDHGSDVWELVK